MDGWPKKKKAIKKKRFLKKIKTSKNPQTWEWNTWFHFNHVSADRKTWFCTWSHKIPKVYKKKQKFRTVIQNRAKKNETASHLARQPHTNHIINNTKTNNQWIVDCQNDLSDQFVCKGTLFFVTSNSFKKKKSYFCALFLEKGFTSLQKQDWKQIN